jgi:hypothetical protein
MEVGGIRISHMSHIERDLTLALTVTKAKRAPYRVQVLEADHAEAQRGFVMLTPEGKEWRAPSVEKWEAACMKAIGAAPDALALLAWERAMEPHLAAAPADAAARVRRAAADRSAALDAESGA